MITTHLNPEPLCLWQHRIRFDQLAPTLPSLLGFQSKLAPIWLMWNKSMKWAALWRGLWVLTMASCSKDWMKISTELSFLFSWWPDQLKDRPDWIWWYNWQHRKNPEEDEYLRWCQWPHWAVVHMPRMCDRWSIPHQLYTSRHHQVGSQRRTWMWWLSTACSPQPNVAHLWACLLNRWNKTVWEPSGSLLSKGYYLSLFNL